MAYKDKDKQREANAERQRRYKAKQKALPEQGVTSEKALLSEGVTDKALPVEPEVMVEIDNDGNITPVSGKPKRGKDTKSFTDLPNTETIPPVEQVRYRLPSVKVSKRGKDIKVFADLPPHVQQTINMMSTTDGKLDQTIKANRTAIAINYQHQFPDRYHSTGVV